MPNYVLHYFNIRGRAEFSRLILAASGIEYKDDRVTNWPATKSEAPLGQLPYLEIDDFKLPQSVAIARYFAKEGHIAGKDNLEQAKADAIVDTVVDGYNAFLNKVFSAADDQKEEAEKKYLAEDVPKHFGNIEKLIGLYGKNGYSVGDSLTWADLYVYEFTSGALTKLPTVLDAFPLISKVRKSVEANEKVAAYLKSRPNSPV